MTLLNYPVGQYTQGITLKLCNLSVFTLMSFLFIAISKHVNIIHVNFLILLFTFSISWLAIKIQRITVKVGNIRYYWLRALFNVLGLFSWFKALKMIGINEATAISYMIPIFTMLFSSIFCNERIHPICLLGVIASFIGMYIIINPNFADYSKYEGSIFAIFAALMWASYDITCKKQTKTEHYLVQTMLTAGCSVIIMLLFVVYDYGEFALFGKKDIVFTLVIGMLATVNITILFLAYRAAPINILMPFSYFRLLIVALPNYFIFGNTLHINSLVGFMIILGSSIFIFYRQLYGKLVIIERNTDKESDKYTEESI